ncbi:MULTISPECIES: DUF4021 domain-containing protein [Bacillaceae]|jgi:hypothetical protein|uniref:DUF4021 domain-containing protein n=1 Tax=Bacillaceae TaxID=186817 RepID=UPI00101C6372|nr:DUF4021 domain-containing protein [Ectobacillus funiculus]
MNNPYSRKEEQSDTQDKNPHRNRSEAAIGLDMDEQAMNGLYGQPETDIENNSHTK